MGLIRNKHFNQLTYKINVALLVWEIEEQNEKEAEQFKQAMVQAFPSLYQEIYNRNDGEESIEGYEQITSTDDEEFVSIMDFIQNMHTMSFEELKVSD